jgi:hypothetical protein
LLQSPLDAALLELPLDAAVLEWPLDAALLEWPLDAAVLESPLDVLGESAVSAIAPFTSANAKPAICDGSLSAALHAAVVSHAAQSVRLSARSLDCTSS